MKALVYLLSLSLVSFSTMAQEYDREYEAYVDSVEKTMHYKYGTITLGSNLATLVVPEGS